MATLIAWLVANWPVLVGIIGGLLSLASLVTSLTKSPKDDEWVKKLIGWLSFLTHNDTVGTLKAPLTPTKKV